MTASVALVEWQVAGPAEAPELRGRSLTGAGRAQAHALAEGGRLRILELREGLRVEATSYVGAVSLGDLVIQVRPKLGSDVMPTFLRYALDLPQRPAGPRPEVPLAPWGFMDLVGQLVLEEVDGILLAGLFQDYRPAEAWLGSPRGRLRFSELARQPGNAHLALPCRYLHRTPDVVLNRLAAATLASVRELVLARSLQLELHAREALLLEFCQEALLSPALLAEARAAADRRSSYYEPLLQLATVVLANAGAAFTADQSRRLPGFLIDMNRLFERFVARLCREYVPSGCRVEVQATGRDAFRCPVNPHRWTAPELQPDIVVRRENGCAGLILDTKYKLLDGRLPAAADLYQLTLYSMGFGRGGWVPARLVYPTVGPAPAETLVHFMGFQRGGALGAVSVYGLDLLACAEAIRFRQAARVRSIVAELTMPNGPEG